MKFLNINQFIQLFLIVSLIQAKNIPIDFLYQNDNNSNKLNNKQENNSWEIMENEMDNKWNLKENDIIFNWRASNPFNNEFHLKKCPSEIMDQGYSCCVNECTYMYIDKNGSWSIENGEWCLCLIDSYEDIYDEEFWNDNSQYDLDVEDNNKKDNNNTYDEKEIKDDNSHWMSNINDIMSSWKINNDNHQISSALDGKCPSTISDKGYRCCIESCVSIYSDSNGNWGIENGEWCWCKN